jgi:hypothetical protein
MAGSESIGWKGELVVIDGWKGESIVWKGELVRLDRVLVIDEFFHVCVHVWVFACA